MARLTAMFYPQAYSQFARDGRCGQLRVIFSFYSSTIVPALEAVEKVSDSLIAKLLPYVQLVSPVPPSVRNTAVLVHSESEARLC